MADVVHYSLAAVTDAQGQLLAVHLELASGPLHLIVEGDRMAYPLTFTARLTAVAPEGVSPIANWTAESDQDDARFGLSVGTAGDVNGDGYSDVIVGAAWFDTGQTDESAAFVYYGMAYRIYPPSLLC